MVSASVITSGIQVLEAVCSRYLMQLISPILTGARTVQTAWQDDAGRWPGEIKIFDAIYFGAVGAPDVSDHITMGLALAICQGFDQYANVRPTKILPGISRPCVMWAGDLDWELFAKIQKANIPQWRACTYDEEVTGGYLRRVG